MKWIVALVLSNALLCGGQTAQRYKTDAQPKSLQRGSVVEEKGIRGPIYGIRYGGKDGFLFESDNDRTLHYASFNGKVTRSYDQGLIPKYAIYGGIIDYAYADGNVYALTYSGKDDKYISKFSSDGTYQSSAKIEIPDVLGCAFMSYIDQGELLINCYRTIKREGKTPAYARVPYTAIIRTNGTLVKELTLARDVSIRENDEERGKHDLDARSAEDVDDILDAGYTDQDSFGNVLLSRYVPFNGTNNLENEHPILFVIKHDRRILRVRLPASRKRGGITFARLIDGKIVSIWTERDDPSEQYKTYPRVFDLTGKKEAEWQYSLRDFGNLVLTWSADRVLFVTLTGDRGKPAMEIVEALPR